MEKTQNFAELLYPGMRTVFGLAHKDYKPEWPQLGFDVESTTQAYEKTLAMAGFGLAAKMPEGSGVSYADAFQGPTHNIYLYQRGLGYMVTKQMYICDQYNQINALPKAARKSMNQTKERDHADIFNYGFSSTYADGSSALGIDSICLFSASHTAGKTNGITIANTPSTAAVLSFTALEQAKIDIAAWVDPTGIIKVNYRAMKLITTEYNDWSAYQLLGADKDPETPGSNAPNPAKSMFPEGRVVSHYITEPTFWGILTDCDNGLVSYKHSKWSLDLTRDNDFNSDNMLNKATDFYGIGWDDFRCVYGSQVTS